MELNYINFFIVLAFNLYFVSRYGWSFMKGVATGKEGVKAVLFYWLYWAWGVLWLII